MNSSKLRIITAGIVFVLLCAGLIAGVGMGTLSGFGWDTISVLCPMGALTTMIATKTFLPRALVSIVIMAALVFVLGRAFCGWMCPVPLLDKIRAFFRSPAKREAMEKEKHDEILSIAKADLGCGGTCASCKSACAQNHAKIDSRHYVLGGALLSTAVFGFPVFCLVCPIGLTFATAMVVWRLFANGDVTVLALLAPALLILELVVFRKWCTRICPMAGLMNLMSRFSRTFKPMIDDARCLETAKGVACSKCAMVCEADINLRHMAYGERTLADCTRCRACVEACPADAISMPFLVKPGSVVQANADASVASPDKTQASLAEEG